MRKWTLFCSLSIALLLIACNTIDAIDPIPEGPLSQPDSNRFERLQTKSSTRVYRRVGASLAPYTKILLQPLDVELREGWNPAQEGQNKIKLQDARQRVAMVFEDEMTRALQATGRYSVARSPGPDVLELRPQIVDLYVKAVDEAAKPASGVSTYEVNDAELTLAGDLRDSMTGTVLYRFYDQHRSQSGGAFMDSQEGRSEQFRRLISGWASQLTQAMDAARAP
jgi:hypothetical protein